MDKTCAGCGTTSPETETPYTLISSKFGWRLTWTYDAKGQRVSSWRCPACWKKAKEKTDGKAGV